MNGNPPYHERQGHFDMMCLIHALNMLLGRQKMDKRTLDDACDVLSPNSHWWNPHRNPLGLGNYDVNVAMWLLQEEGLDVSFFDGRKDARELPLEHDSMVVGLLLNVVGSKWIPGSRHWMTYRKQAKVWWKLDSQEKGPILVERIWEAMSEHLSKGDHILIVRTRALL